MADELNKLDKSYRPTISGVTNDSDAYITIFKFDSAQERLLVESTGEVVVTGGATEDKQDNIISAINSIFPSGSASNGTVTLTDADTAYAVPATASTKNHILILHNGSDSDMYVGYATLTTGGILLPAGGTMTVDLGASQKMYAYCGSAGKVINYSYKEVS